MDFRRVYAIFLRQIFLIRNNKTRLVNIFMWISIDTILWGFITNYLDSMGHSGFSFSTTVLGAVVLWNFLIRIQQGLMLSFFEDMWSCNLLNLFASPLRIREYLSGLVISSLATSIAGLSVMLFIAWGMFLYNIFQFGVLLVPFLGIMLVFGFALGIFTTALVLRFGPPAEWIAWIIPFVLDPFTGIFYPISALPKILQPISAILPPSYVFEGMRGALLSGKFSVSHLIAGISIAFVYLIISCLFFLYIYRIVLRKGLIARLTAENL
ncbi:MAG: ABC transporter permease [Candidatus Brocadia sp.]|nr:ABC transporter permease [Candidatus Brocadia sp.]